MLSCAASLPGSPPLNWLTSRPGMRPASALLMLAVGDCLRSLVVIVEIEPVMVSFFCTL
jgi:hypothetical protein